MAQGRVLESAAFSKCPLLDSSPSRNHTFCIQPANFSTRLGAPGHLPAWLPADCLLQKSPPIRFLRKNNYSEKKKKILIISYTPCDHSFVRLETWVQLQIAHCPFLSHSHRLILVTGKRPSSLFSSWWLKQVGHAQWGDMMWEKWVQLNNRAFNTQLPGPYLAN